MSFEHTSVQDLRVPRGGGTLTFKTALLLQFAGGIFTLGLMYGVYSTQMADIRRQVEDARITQLQGTEDREVILRKLEAMEVKMEIIYKETLHQRGLIEKELLGRGSPASR